MRRRSGAGPVLATLSLLTGLLLTQSGCIGGPNAPRLYAELCSECHAPDGRGDPYRVGLSPGLDLHRSTALRTGATGWVYRTIRHGYSAMPGFDHQLEHVEIEALVDYVIELVADDPVAP